jgi:hypothetical protein
MSVPITGSAVASPSDPPRHARLGLLRTCKHIVRDPVTLVLVSPTVIAVLFWILVLCGVIASGAWVHGHEAPPGTYEYRHPSIDPKSFGPLYLIVGFSMFAAPVLIVVGAGLSVISIFHRGLRRNRMAHVAFVVGSALWFATVAFDLGGGVDWFID